MPLSLTKFPYEVLMVLSKNSVDTIGIPIGKLRFAALNSLGSRAIFKRILLHRIVANDLII